MTDYYPVILAAAHQDKEANGERVLKGMILMDEINSRLTHYFTYERANIDPKFSMAIAAICSYGAMIGATPQQIETGMGLFGTYYLPFKIYHSQQYNTQGLTSGSSFILEAAMTCIDRALNGFKVSGINPFAKGTLLHE